MTQTKSCYSCKEIKPLTDFHVDNARKYKRASACKECRKVITRSSAKAYREKNIKAIREQQRQHRVDNIEEYREKGKKDRRARPELYMWYDAGRRARQQKVPFTLTKEDITIPNKCPVLGMTLKQGVGKPLPSSPTLDKIIPELGYVLGNIKVISYRANSLKSDASLEELKKIVNYIEEETNE